MDVGKEQVLRGRVRIRIRGLVPSQSTRLAAAWTILFMLVVTACGSTSSETDPISPRAHDGQPTPDAGLSEEDLSEEEEASEAREGGGSRPGVDGVRGPGSGESGSVADPSALEERAARSGKGVTDTSVAIGIEVVKGADETVGAIGSETAQGDHRAAAEGVVAYLNAKGGVAGRKIEVVYQETDGNSGTYSSHAQRTCERFTRDHSVFAVLSGHFGTSVGPSLVECLSKRDTPLIGGGLQYPWDDAAYTRYEDYLYEPDELSVSRWDLWIDELVRRSFFGSSPKIGVYRFDTDLHERLMEETLEPALGAHGLAVAEEAAVTMMQQTADLGTTGGQTSNAVLRFRNAGVTHVLFVATQATGPFFFMPNAESQGYRPRYSINSFEKPDFVQRNVPKAQLSGLVGVGWKPMLDVDAARDPGGRPGYDRCRAIFQEAGLAFDDRNAERVAMEYCDILLFFKGAFEAAHDLTTTGFRSAVDSLGGQHESAVAFRSRFGSGRHYGAGAIGTLAFRQECGCMAYVGGARDIP